MKTKPILCPERLRHAPRQFSWIDQRLVRDRHIQGRSPDVPPALPASAAPPRAGEVLSAAARRVLMGNHFHLLLNC